MTSIAQFPQRVVHVRTSVPRALIAGAEVDFGDATGPGDLVACSNDGLAFCLPAGYPLGGVCCEAILHNVRVWAGSVPVLGPVDLEIRSVVHEADGYRIECAFVARFGTRAIGRTIGEPTHIAALFSEALQRSGLTLRLAGAQDRRITVTRGTVGPESLEADLADGVDALRPLDLVEGAFDLNGARYEFTAVVHEAEPLRIRLPRTLIRHEDRRAVRQPWNEAATLRMRHPLTGQAMALSVCDVAAGGIGVVLGDDMPDLPISLQIAQATLEFRGRQFDVRGEVCHLDRRDADVAHAGLRIEFASAVEQAQFGELQALARFPLVESCGAQNFDALFAFIDRAGGIPDGVSAGSVRPTFERVHRAPPTLCRTLVKRNANAFIAHGCALKRYSRTWTFEPVTSATGDEQTALTLGRAILESCTRDPAMRFVHASYAVTNALSSRLVAAALPGIAGAGRWNLALRLYATIRGIPAAPTSGSVGIRTPKNFADLVAAERIIAENEPPILLEANDWQAVSLPMQVLDAEYRREGLMRTRRLFVAEINGKAAGFGLAELSSRGMSVGEDFSAARIWVGRNALVCADEVRRALVHALGQFYAACSRSAWHLIADREHEAFVTGLAAHPPIQFAEAIIRRDAVAQLCAIWAGMTRAPTPCNSTPVARAA